MNSLRLFGLSSLLFSAVLAQGENSGSNSDTSTNECDDAYECLGGDIKSYYIYCRGYYACEESLLNSTYQINWGAYGAYYAFMEVSNTVYAYGIRVNYAAFVETTYLLSYGFQSSIYSEIEPYSKTIEIQFYGYYSGYYSNVYCRSGEICTIYCGSAFGCYETTFYCYSGATCSYNCDDDEDYCPTLFSGYDTTIIGGNSNGNDLSKHFSDLTDEQIDHYRQERLEKRQIKMGSKAENDVKLIEIAQKRELEREQKNFGSNPYAGAPGAPGNAGGVAGLFVPKLDLNEMAKILSVIEDNNHIRKKTDNSILYQINDTGFGPLIYSTIGSLCACLLASLGRKVYEAHITKTWTNGAEYRRV